jgi:flagellar motor switch protein FliM
MSAALRRLEIGDLRARAGAPVEALAAFKPRFDDFAAQLVKKLETLAGSSLNLAVNAVERAVTSPDVYKSETHWISTRIIGDRDGVELTARLDRQLVFALCETAFGGAGTDKPYRDERPFSTIERRLSDAVFLLVAESLGSMFADTRGTGITFHLASQDETKQVPLPPLNAEAKLLLKAFGHSGEMVLGFGKAVIDALKCDEPVPRQLVVPKQQIGKKPRLSGQIGAIDVDLTVVLAEVELDIRELTGLHVGKLIKLPTRLDSTLKVYSDERCLFDAHFVRSESACTICINRLSS